jgi:hypothetical protein
MKLEILAQELAVSALPGFSQVDGSGHFDFAVKNRRSFFVVCTPEVICQCAARPARLAAFRVAGDFFGYRHLGRHTDVLAKLARSAFCRITFDTDYV